MQPGGISLRLRTVVVRAFFAAVLALATAACAFFEPCVPGSGDTAFAEEPSESDAGAPRQVVHGEGETQFTDSERERAAATPTLRVGMLPGREPMSYVDAAGQVSGVTRDVLDRIALETGFAFEYVMLDGDGSLGSQAEAFDLDIVAGCEAVLESEADFGFTMSSPYSTTRAVVAFNASHAYGELSTEMVMAVTYDRAEQYESLGYTVVAYPTVAECLAAVDSGEAAYTYENSHVIPLVLGEGVYNNVLTVDASFQNVNLCLALVEPHDDEVLVLLDKAIETIPARDVISLVYDHTYANHTLTLQELISQHPTEFALIISVPLLVVVIALAFIAFTRSRAASHDPLTQLLNASTFRRKVLVRLRKSGGTAACCIVIIDIDDFKRVNDSYGHFEGDRALKAAAAALKEACGKGEYAARMGGGEFLAYWTGDSIEGIEGRADALIRSVTQRIGEIESIADTVTASIGIACARPGEDYDHLYRRADAALYHGKETEKGRSFVDGCCAER